MKNKLKELNVDFIGGQGPMTKEEELAISKFIKADKQKRKVYALSNIKPKRITKAKQLS